MTLLEMQAYFQVLLAEKTTSSDFIESSEMTDLINEGGLIFGIETKIVRPTYQELTLATGVSANALSATFLAVTEGVFLYSAAGVYKHEIKPLEEGYKKAITNASSNGEPQFYSIRGFTKATAAASPQLNLNLEPPPSASFNGYLARVFYAKIPLTLSGATDVSDIPVQFHRGPVCLAVSLFKERDQEFDQAGYFRKKAQYWIDKATSEQYRWDRTPKGFRFAKGQYVKR